jgi:ribosome-binding ATPase YchF (GTP1/OBG family)
VRTLDFSKEELPLLKPLCLITAKPAMFVGNVAETALRTTPSWTACANTPLRRMRRWWPSAPRWKPRWPT